MRDLEGRKLSKYDGITQAYLQSLFTYDPETGVFARKVRRSNQPAGTPIRYIDSVGYYAVSINKKLYRVHRLIFIYMGEELPEVVDHINTIRLDNRWCNLRGTNKQGNNQNASAKGGVVGHKGVCITASGNYGAYVWHNGKRLWLGSFTELQDAIDITVKTRDNLHKEFANHGEDK